MTTDLAVPGTGRDEGVPWHFGDPLREQRVMTTGAAVVDRSNRDVLVVPGQDRLGWLHSISSQHLSALGDGDATEALVLSPHGHVEQHWQVTELDSTVWIDTEPGTAAEVLGYLHKMQFMKRVEPADVSAQWAVLSLVGPATPTVLALAGLPTPDRPGRAAPVDGGGFVRRMSWPGPDAADLVVPRARAQGVIEALTAAGASRAGLWAFEALRGRGTASAAGIRDRSPHDPARGRLDRLARCTWTRAATAARRRSPGCRTSASRRAGSSCCTFPANRTHFPSPARRWNSMGARWASSARPYTTSISDQSPSP